MAGRGEGRPGLGFRYRCVMPIIAGTRPILKPTSTFYVEGQAKARRLLMPALCCRRSIARLDSQDLGVWESQNRPALVQGDGPTCSPGAPELPRRWGHSMGVNVAVLGLGMMGSALVRDAARAGLHATGWDRTDKSAAVLASDGVHVPQTAPEAVRDADVVVTMVPDADAVLSVMQERGAFTAMKAGASWVPSRRLASMAQSEQCV